MTQNKILLNDYLLKEFKRSEFNMNDIKNKLKRRFSRFKVNYHKCFVVFGPSYKRSSVELLNISQKGCLIRYNGVAIIDDLIIIDFIHKDTIIEISGIVKHINNNFVGIVFDEIIDQYIIKDLISFLHKS